MAVDVSGALQSKGHLIVATGLAKVFEITTHLRDEAGKRQNTNARLRLAKVIGLSTACGIPILEQASS